VTTTGEQLDAAQALMVRWRTGDAGARDTMLTRIHPALYRWALAYVADADEAEDVAQQALIIVNKKIGQFRGDAPLGVWLYRITMRAAGQRRRSHKRRERLGMLPRAQPERIVYETDPGARVDRERLTARVHELYQALPPRQRAVLQLVDLEGHSPAEAAEMMDLAPVTLRANLFKARASIRRRLCAEVPALAERFAKLDDPSPPELA
jgi:RNA polymerase sigma factor (sigma-70 family)